MSTEHAFTFGRADAPLVGVLHEPEKIVGSRGVVVVVGGPQYRVGSHRQFVLLARSLAARGVPVLRFDQSGCGDSAGDAGGFESLDGDLRTAIDELLRREPRVERVCIWGLCDGASAALIYAMRDPRIDRLILLNPWVRSEGSLAQAYLDNYYRRRLRAPAFWRKMLTNPFAVARAMLGYADNRRDSARAATAQVPSFVERMLDGARAFRGRTLVVLSGADTVAAEFSALVERDADWRKIFSGANVATLALADANHTFSRREWRDRVAERSAEFVLG
jgi:exosortase A-associated hydrolase 1